MKNIVRLFLAVTLACFGASAFSQANTVVSASGFNTSATQMCFSGTDVNNNVITYTPAGGSPISTPQCFAMSGGSLTGGGASVANANTASPQPLFYRIQVTNGSLVYLTLLQVQIFGSAYSMNSYAVPAAGYAVGTGTPTIACASGARFSSTTLVAGKNYFTCSSSGTWQTYPTGPFCGTNQGQLASQASGTQLCIASETEGSGPPSGICTEKQKYFQVDASSGSYFWGCINGSWLQSTAGSTGATGPQGPAGTDATPTSVVSNTFTGSSGSPQTLTFSHNLGTLNPSASWFSSTGTVPTCNSPIVVDANNISLTCSTAVAVTGVFTFAGTGVNVLLDGLAAHWPINDGSGATSLLDKVAGDNLIDLNGISWSGTVATFSGAANDSDAIIGSTAPPSVPPVPYPLFSGTLPFSISFGINYASLSTSTQLSILSNMTVGSSPGFEIDVQGSSASVPGALEVAMISNLGSGNFLDLTSTTAPFVTGQRYAVSITYDGSKSASGFKVYVNGTLISMTTAHDALTGSIVPTQFNTVMCSPNFGETVNNTNGSIDNIMFHDLILSPTVVAVYASKTPMQLAAL